MKDGSGRYLCREGQLGIWTEINKTKRAKSGSLGSVRFGIHELWQLLGPRLVRRERGYVFAQGGNVVL